MPLRNSAVGPSERDRPTDPGEIWRTAIVTALRDAATQLTESLDAEPRVHALRRAAKQLRALAALAPPPLGDLARDTRDHADTLRRSLGHTRDAAVRRETFARLARDLEDGGIRLAPALEKAPEDAERPSVPGNLHGELVSLAEQWSRCDLQHVSTEALAEALSATYRRARKRWKAVHGGDADELHRWRRAIVDLDLQAGTFGTISPWLSTVGKRAHGLRERLGRVNDIEGLLTFLANAPDLDAEALTALKKLADDERERLIRKADHGAARLLDRRVRAWREDVSGLLYAAARTAEAAAPMKIR